MKKNTLLIILLVILAVGGIFLLSNNSSNVRSTRPSTGQQSSSAAYEESAFQNTTYGHVHALIVNPQDNNLLMGTHNGLFRSADGGKTFKNVEVKGEVMASDFMNFAYGPNTNTLFAGGHDLGVVKSTDGGTTWTKTDSGIRGTDIHALAINPLDTNRLYAYSVGNGVFGTKDGAKSWYRIDDGPDNPAVRAFGYMATPSSMDRSMRTDKTTNIGYLWGGTSGGLYSSFACFCGWTKTSGISDNATIYTLAPDPVNRSTMFAGTKDGIFKTTDEGKTFTRTNSDISNVAAIAFDESNPKIFYAATANGTLYKSDDGGENWSKIQ